MVLFKTEWGPDALVTEGYIRGQLMPRGGLASQDPGDLAILSLVGAGLTAAEEVSEIYGYNNETGVKWIQLEDGRYRLPIYHNGEHTYGVMRGIVDIATKVNQRVSSEHGTRDPIGYGLIAVAEFVGGGHDYIQSLLAPGANEAGSLKEAILNLPDDVDDVSEKISSMVNLATTATQLDVPKTGSITHSYNTNDPDERVVTELVTCADLLSVTRPDGATWAVNMAVEAVSAGEAVQLALGEGVINMIEITSASSLLDAMTAKNNPHRDQFVMEIYDALDRQSDFLSRFKYQDPEIRRRTGGIGIEGLFRDEHSSSEPSRAENIYQLTLAQKRVALREPII